MEYTFSSSLEGLSNEDIAARCQHAPRLSSDINTTKVVKILPDIAVKFGTAVFQDEATTMDYVFHHTDRNILRVPRVYRFFTHGEWFDRPIGYIAMEFVSGVTLEARSTPVESDLIKSIVKALDHLSTLAMHPSQGPGPVDGGIPRGYLWTDDGAGTTFASMKDMENWLNRQLDISRNQLSRFSLGSAGLCFSHMDIARRNIIITEADELCFVDWTFAGFYPPSFQRFCIEWCSADDDPSFTINLLQQLPGSYKDGEEYLMGELIRNNCRYGLRNLSKETDLSSPN